MKNKYRTSYEKRVIDNFKYGTPVFIILAIIITVYEYWDIIINFLRSIID